MDAYPLDVDEDLFDVDDERLVLARSVIRQELAPRLADPVEAIVRAALGVPWPGSAAEGAIRTACAELRAFRAGGGGIARC